MPQLACARCVISNFVLYANGQRNQSFVPLAQLLRKRSFFICVRVVWRDVSVYCAFPLCACVRACVRACCGCVCVCVCVCIHLLSSFQCSSCYQNLSVKTRCRQCEAPYCQDCSNGAIKEGFCIPCSKKKKVRVFSSFCDDLFCRFLFRFILVIYSLVTMYFFLYFFFKDWLCFTCTCWVCT